MRNNRKGFTLIEMLVVIAVIGILSAAVLTALGPSRAKAKDTRIISALQQVRALAEANYQNDYSWLPSGTIANSDGKLGTSASDISTNGGSLVINKATSSAAYAAYSVLASGGYYCLDSAGNAKNEGTDPGTAVPCP